MWQSFLLPTLTSVIGSWLIILGFWLYNRKRQSDAKTNEYTRLVNEIANLNTKIANASDARENDHNCLTNEIANLNSKIDNESEARNNQYTHLSNELNNLNSKFDNGFERFFIEIDKLKEAISINANSISNNSSAIKNLNDIVLVNQKNLDRLTDILIGKQEE